MEVQVRRHALDGVSLVAGLVFLLIAVLGLTGIDWRLHVDVRWVLPVVLVAIGVVGLTVALGRRRD